MEPSTTGLYSIHQTQVYVPPPVTRGRITKNAFGNLDVYVPSMVPPGGAHIRHPLTQQAARALKIDYADAVTGFKFQGRQGTAIIEGAVVPEEHRAAVLAVIEGLEQEALEQESRARSLLALRLWSRFMKGLRIAARVASYSEKVAAQDVGDEETDEKDFANGAVSALSDNDPDPTMPTAGRYTLDELAKPAKLARKNKKKVVESENEDYEDPVQSSRRSGRKRGAVVVEDDEDEYMPDAEDGGDGGGFLAEDAQEVRETGGGFVPEEPGEGHDDYHGGSGGFLPEDTQEVHGSGGGFVSEQGGNEDHDDGGGFVREDGDAGNMGGGFLPEDGDAQDTGGGFLPDDGGDGRGGGFLAEDADHDSTDDLFDEKTQDAESHEVGDHFPTPDVKASNSETAEDITMVEDSSSKTTGTDIPTMHSSIITNTTAPSHDISVVEADKAAVDNEQDSDRGSLLSHDPEDDDAEPDWLESD
jgi:xeroderma pigmentosum group C-complementing protein